MTDMWLPLKTRVSLASGRPLVARWCRQGQPPRPGMVCPPVSVRHATPTSSLCALRAVSRAAQHITVDCGAHPRGLAQQVRAAYAKRVRPFLAPAQQLQPQLLPAI